MPVEKRLETNTKTHNVLLLKQLLKTSFGKQLPNGYQGPPDWTTLENLASWTQTLMHCLVFAPDHQAGAPVPGLAMGS